ncbi:hypothetical protein CCP2SC5_840006 [Azospirillaceae bacterium]
MTLVRNLLLNFFTLFQSTRQMLILGSVIVVSAGGPELYRKFTALTACHKTRYYSNL